MKKVGEVTHYFGKPQVAVLNISGEIKVGDKIKFVKNGEDLFEQEISSLEIDHEKVEKAGKGSDVALKVDDKVHEGNEVYLVE